MTQHSNYCLDCNGPCIATRLHGIPKSRVGSGSRIFSGNVVGKKLTDRQITKYEKAGKYGGTIKLPEKTSSRCSCGSSKEVKHRTYSYLPKDGYWCAVCIEKYRKARDKAKELAARIRAAMKEDYI